MILANLIDPISRLLDQWLNISLNEINIFSILIRLILAVICAGVIGVERAKKRHAAGFRTYILVCLGATIVMLTNQFLFETYETGDVARLGAQVISGIGFLGAGTILVTSRSQIKGLTTAAGLWASACLGLAIGVGFYTLVICGTLIIVVSLSMFPKIENYFTSKSPNVEIHIELETRANLKDFINYARAKGIKIRLVENNSAYARSGLSVYTINLETNKIDNNSLIEEIRSLPYVNFVEIIY